MKNVLVTGSSRGIGEATAAAFLANGDRAAIFCRHKEHVDAAVARLVEGGADRERILPFVGDVRSVGDAKRIVTETAAAFGAIDVLVNNAGIGLYKRIAETTDAEWDDVLATNLRGQFLFLREAVPFMKKGGVIVNVSSVLGLSGEAKYSAYSAAKFGIVGLTQVAAAELKAQGIKVYAVCPAGVATKLHLDMHPWEDPATMMTPAHVASKILPLAKGAKKSGATVVIDR